MVGIIGTLVRSIFAASQHCLLTTPPQILTHDDWNPTPLYLQLRSFQRGGYSAFPDMIKAGVAQ
jgi:hypothetical protein